MSVRSWGLFGWLLVWVAAGSHAQDLAPGAALRDPTLAPLAAPADTGAGDAIGSPASPLGGSGTNVVVRNGKPYLVVGSRLVAPGQAVENYKLERITETEVWLRDASGLTKLPRYAGVQRTVVSPQCSVAATTAKKPPAKKKPRAGVPQRHPSNPSTGPAAAPRPIRENDAHDC